MSERKHAGGDDESGRGAARRDGLPMALYTDRAHWAFHTPKAKGPVDKTQLTQVGRALARLGIEHIPAYSPQARGRSERLNRTFQDRLVNELRVAGITTLAAANRYLARAASCRSTTPPSRAPPRDPASAFVPLGDVDLEQILCHEEERVVARDNTVTSGAARCRSRPRRSCVGLTVTVRQHLDGAYTITRGTQRLGTIPPTGGPGRCRSRGRQDAPTAAWKTPKPRFPQRPQASL